MQLTTAEVSTPIEVLKMLDQRLLKHVAHSINQLPDTEFGNMYSAHIKDQSVEETGHIEKAAMQLQNWLAELLQQSKRQVAQSV